MDSIAMVIKKSAIASFVYGSEPVITGVILVASFAAAAYYWIKVKNGKVEVFEPAAPLDQLNNQGFNPRMSEAEVLYVAPQWKKLQTTQKDLQDAKRLVLQVVQK